VNWLCVAGFCALDESTPRQLLAFPKVPPITGWNERPFYIVSRNERIELVGRAEEILDAEIDPLNCIRCIARRAVCVRSVPRPGPVEEYDPRL
jgi:hypothetical protein